MNTEVIIVISLTFLTTWGWLAYNEYKSFKAISIIAYLVIIIVSILTLFWNNIKDKIINDILEKAVWEMGTDNDKSEIYKYVTKENILEVSQQYEINTTSLQIIMWSFVSVTALFWFLPKILSNHPFNKTKHIRNGTNK